MTRTDRFKDLAAVRAEKLRLDALREWHGERLEQHFNALKQGDFRTALMKNAVSSAFGGSTPGKLLGSLIGTGGIAGGLGMAMGSGKGSLLKRAGLFALGLAAPKLMKKVSHISLPDIGEELHVSWERLKDHLEVRREEKALRKVKDDPADR